MKLRVQEQTRDKEAVGGRDWGLCWEEEGACRGYDVAGSVPLGMR